MESVNETTKLLSQRPQQPIAISKAPPTIPAMLYSYQQATTQPDFLLSGEALMKLAQSGDASAQYLIGKSLIEGTFWIENKFNGSRRMAGKSYK